MWGLRDRAILLAYRGVIPSRCPGDFVLASVFCWNYFSRKKNQQHTCCILLKYLLITPPPPKYIMRSPVVIITKDVMEKKRIETKIGLGFVVKANVG